MNLRVMHEHIKKMMSLPMKTDEDRGYRMAYREMNKGFNNLVSKKNVRGIMAKRQEEIAVVKDKVYSEMLGWVIISGFAGTIIGFLLGVLFF